MHTERDALTEAVFNQPTETNWDALYDLLRREGDPCAQLADATDRESMLRQVATEWFGPDARVAEGCVVLSRGDHEDGTPGSAMTLAFERGHIAQLTIDVRYPTGTIESMDADPASAWMPEAITSVLQHPAGKLVRAVTVSQAPDYHGDRSTQWLADALSGSGPVAARSLCWGHFSGFAFVNLPFLEAVRDQMPFLESLTLQGEWSEENPELQLHDIPRVQLAALSAETLTVLASQDLSSVESLSLWLYDDENDGAEELTLDDLSCILEAPLPSLRALSFHDCEFGDALIASLPTFPLLRQLHTLGLLRVTRHGSYLGQASADALLSEGYAHLSGIRVTKSFDAERLHDLEARSNGRIAR